MQFLCKCFYGAFYFRCFLAVKPNDSSRATPDMNRTYACVCVCVCARVCMCANVCVQASLMYDIPALLHINGIHTLFSKFSTKSSQLLHPSLYSLNTHTHTHIHTLASSTIDFGIHCCHGNGIEHALSHRLFFSIALSLSLSVEANQLLLFD